MAGMSIDHHGARRSRLGISAAALTFGLAAWCGPSALAAVSGPAVATVLTSCSFPALKSAVAAGGTVDYGVSCTSPPVSFTSTITVPTGLSVDIEASGHTVTFDGGAKVRLFQVTGGRLTIGGISLNSAQVSTASGKAGSNGAAGAAGSSGAAGANGANGSSPGANGGPGQPGGAGGAATAGQAGGAGKN